MKWGLHGKEYKKSFAYSSLYDEGTLIVACYVLSQFASNSVKAIFCEKIPAPLFLFRFRFQFVKESFTVSKNEESCSYVRQHRWKCVKCYICQATPEEMTDIRRFLLKESDGIRFEFWWLPVHSWILIFEYFLHLSYSMGFKMW